MVTLLDSGAVDAPAVSVTAASLTLGGKTVGADALPQSVGLIPAGGTGVVTLHFPGAGVLTGATAALRLSGGYAATGTFSASGAAPLPH